MNTPFNFLHVRFNIEDMKQLPLRPNVCMLVLNSTNQLFMGERLSHPGIWQFPQGGIENHLSEEENVYKELYEEIGAVREKLEILQKLQSRNDYEFRTPPHYAVGKWRGQSQSFWLVRFIGEDSDIRLDRHVPEFNSWRWVSIDEVAKLAEPIRIKGYAPALQELKSILKTI